jgi:transcriptional regulator with XRE-family HTH domain
METFGEYIRKIREQRNMPLRKLAALLDIDQSTLSKIERNERHFSKELVPKLSLAFDLNCNELKVKFLSDRITYELKDEELGIEALRVAEKQIEYFQKKQHSNG